MDEWVGVLVTVPVCRDIELYLEAQLSALREHALLCGRSSGMFDFPAPEVVLGALGSYKCP